MIIMWSLPMMSVFLFLVSIFIIIQNKKEREGIVPKIFLALNGTLLFSLIVFFIYFFQDERIITAIPAPVYWLLILLGIIVGLFSASANYVPGYLTSAAILMFTGFIALFSIGIVLILLAIVELLIAFSQYKKLKRKA